MTATKYTYNINIDFPNAKVDTDALTYEISTSTISRALDRIDTQGNICDIWFKEELIIIDATSTLPAIVAAHDGEPIVEVEAPTMTDGRPIVRADSRPFDFQTYYTMAGDDSTAGIGGGEDIMWDFSNNDNIVTGDHVPSGMKCKQFLISFLCPVYTKDGAIYFFDAPWGCYVMMDIVIPPGQWYPNPAGSVPASALGLTGTDMYANTGTDYVVWANYVMRYRICGSCPMGDELNAEGSAINPIPIGWCIRGRVYTPSTDTTSKGYAEFELHRCHTTILPGQTIQDLIDAH